MTRIIGGAAGGRRLAVPDSGTRPTSDRVREALFSSLDARIAPWGDVRVLDLYAGSGALGLEAASRGAAAVTLVESAAKAAEVIARNITAVGLAGVRCVRSDVGRFLESRPPAGDEVGLVLIDPPYDLPGEAVDEVLRALMAQGWLRAGALVVVERSARSLKDSPLAWPEGFTVVSERKYGDTALCLGRWSDA